MKAKKILIGSMIAIGVLITLSLIFIRPALPRFWRGLNDKFSDDSYEQRTQENEQQIKERLLASCDLVGENIYHLDYSADGKYIAISASDIEIRDGTNLNLIKRWPYGGIGPVAFHPNSRILAHSAAGPDIRDGQVEIRTVPDGELIKTIYTDTDKDETDYDIIEQVEFSPDGKYLLTHARYESRVMVWNTDTPPTGEASWSLKYALKKNEPYNAVQWTRFNPDSQSVYVSSESPLYNQSGKPVSVDQQAGWISQYRLIDGQKISELRNSFLLGCSRFYFSNRGKKIILEGIKKTNEQDGRTLLMAIFILAPPQELIWLSEIQGAGERSMDFINTYLGIGSSSGIFTIWDIEKQKRLYGVDLHGRIGELCFSSDGQKVAAAVGGSCYLFRVP